MFKECFCYSIIFLSIMVLLCCVYIIFDSMFQYMLYMLALYFFINFLILIYLILLRLVKLDSAGWPRCVNKIKNSEVIHPFEIVLDSWYYIINKDVGRDQIISLIILIILSPLINLIIMLAFVFFLLLLIKTIKKILRAVIFNESSVIEPNLYNKKFSLMAITMDIIRIHVFSYIYIILNRNKLKLEFRKALNLFIISRIYGKSLMIINIYIYIYTEIVDCLDRRNYIKKKIFIYPVIFYYELKKRIRCKAKIVRDTRVGMCVGRKIYINNGKIRLNPSPTTKWLLEMNPNYLNITIENLIKKMNIKPHDNKYVSEIKNKFVSVKLKNINHLCEFICDIDDSNVLLRSYSTKPVISPKSGLFNTIKGSPIIPRYYEDDIYTQENEEKYCYNIIIKKSEIGAMRNNIILDYYINNNLSSIVFLDLQGKIRTYKELTDGKFRAIVHDKETPISLSKKDNVNDIFFKMSNNLKEIERILEEMVDQIVLPKRTHLTSEQISISKNEIKGIICDEILYMPTTEFQSKCMDSYHCMYRGDNDVIEMLTNINELKKL